MNINETLKREFFKPEYCSLNQRHNIEKLRKVMDRHEVVRNKLCKHFTEAFRTSVLQAGCGYNAVLDV